MNIEKKLCKYSTLRNESEKVPSSACIGCSYSEGNHNSCEYFKKSEGDVKIIKLESLSFDEVYRKLK